MSAGNEPWGVPTLRPAFETVILLVWKEEVGKDGAHQRWHGDPVGAST